MMISKTGKSVTYKQLIAPNQPKTTEAPPTQVPTDSFSFSRGGDDAGWKIAGMTVGLFSFVGAIATKTPALAVVGGVVGLGMAFGLHED